MIPAIITKAHIIEAIRRIGREGVPARRRGRDCCLATNGTHFPPKYTIALAHEVATGERLSSNEFSGGAESNGFLASRGFNVVECNCGGRNQERSATSMSGMPERRMPVAARTRHSERCPECKDRVQELLERIYGSCLPNHRFRWQCGFSSYAGTAIEPALRYVAEALKKYRGFGVEEFVRSQWLAPCDFFVSDRGFIVEFDESQHFTKPRALALAAYADEYPLGFPARRWISLWAQYNRKDSDPLYRDEQRAWYDSLRDLVPQLEGMGPTVRLYASELTWCALDPDDRRDRQRFASLIRSGSAPANLTGERWRIAAGRSPSRLRVAMVFPSVQKRSSNGVPPSGAGAQQPVVPKAASFRDEVIDFALFPEGYIRSSDARRVKSLKRLASKLKAPLLVGAVDGAVDSTGRDWQVLLRFGPDGSSSQIYTKHSTAEAVAFEKQDWEPGDMLPTFELGGALCGATICHDHYLGLLPRFLAKRGARVWVNPSFDNVTDIKWSSILRLRAVENQLFALCTLHCDASMQRGRRRRSTHPFAFSPDGNELWARRPGSDVTRPLSECREAGIYVVDLDMSMVSERLDWSGLPPAGEQNPVGNSQERKPVRIALRGGSPSVLGSNGWSTGNTDFCVKTDFGPVYVGVVKKKRILDAAECFRVLDRARQMKCTPIIWNHWQRLPTDSERLATLMMGRAIECCAPIVISNKDGICELVELSNRNKIPTRRVIEASGEAIMDVRYAWGLDSAFKMVTEHVPRDMKQDALDRYRTLV